MKNPKFIPYWKNLLNFFLDKNTNWKPKAGVAFAVLYLIWPIDIIPDFAPILGWLDDIGITTLATGYLLHAVNRYITANNEQRTTNNDYEKIDTNSKDTKF